MKPRAASAAARRSAGIGGASASSTGSVTRGGADVVLAEVGELVGDRLLGGAVVSGAEHPGVEDEVLEDPQHAERRDVGAAHRELVVPAAADVADRGGGDGEAGERE